MKHWKNYELPNNDLFPSHYDIQEIIRESANGSVLLAYDSLLRSKVIIKCFNNEAKGAYLREISAAFDIQHPNLVRCLTTFHREDNIACIVYEYLAGGSLADILEKQTILPLPTIITCLQAVLNALIYLNSTERIHCDIKPENILLRSNNGKQNDFVLIDLGAACLLREAREGQHVTGTPAYIAPERIKNRFFLNSDLYSLGVIAFEMATGERPFKGSVDELTHANLTHIPSLQNIQPSALRDFIDYLLIKNPEKRLASAELALKLLNKTIKQSNSLISKTKLTTPAIEQSYAQLVLDIEMSPSSIHCFCVNDYPLIALIYTNYVDIIDPLKPKHPLKTLLTNQPLQILGSDLLAYATASRIQVLNLTEMNEQLIKEQLSDVTTWQIGNNSLIWSDAFYCFYEKFNDKKIIKFNVPSYLFSPEVNILNDSQFIVSEGIANNKLVLRDNCAKALQEWQLDDPIVALNQYDDNILVITLNLSNNNSYTLWYIKIKEPARKLVLPENINQIICVNGVAFWLSDKKVLNYCDTSLQPKVLNKFNLSIAKFSVCYGHRFIVIDYKDDNNKLFINILKNRAVL